MHLLVTNKYYLVQSHIIIIKLKKKQNDFDDLGSEYKQLVENFVSSSFDIMKKKIIFIKSKFYDQNITELDLVNICRKLIVSELENKEKVIKER